MHHGNNTGRFGTSVTCKKRDRFGSRPPSRRCWACQAHSGKSVRRANAWHGDSPRSGGGRDTAASPLRRDASPRCESPCHCASWHGGLLARPLPRRPRPPRVNRAVRRLRRGEPSSGIHLVGSRDFFYNNHLAPAPGFAPPRRRRGPRTNPLSASWALRRLRVRGIRHFMVQTATYFREYETARHRAPGQELGRPRLTTTRRTGCRPRNKNSRPTRSSPAASSTFVGDEVWVDVRLQERRGVIARQRVVRRGPGQGSCRPSPATPIQVLLDAASRTGKRAPSSLSYRTGPSGQKGMETGPSTSTKEGGTVVSGRGPPRKNQGAVLLVNIGVKRSFLPASQVDIRRARRTSPTYIGKTIECKILKGSITVACCPARAHQVMLIGPPRSTWRAIRQAMDCSWIRQVFERTFPVRAEHRGSATFRVASAGSVLAIKSER